MVQNMEYVKDNCHFSEDCDIQEDEVFFWDDYLQATHSEPVPNTIFTHVESSLECPIEAGMLVEVLHKKNSENFWVATVLMICDSLLRLRYVGCNDKSKEFWLQITQVHPLGWCKTNGYILKPPEYFENENCYEELDAAVNNGIPVPSEFLSSDGLNAYQRIKQGTKVEVQDKQHPYHLWIATVIENVGGRLRLHYDMPGSSPDFWLFYTSDRLFDFGWTESRGLPWRLEKPSLINSQFLPEEWEAVLQISKEEASRLSMPLGLFRNKLPDTEHQFEVGMKLETVHPHNMTEFYPATVTKVFNKDYFIVEIDRMMIDIESANMDTSWLCTANHPYIFPAGWAKKHGIKLTHPYGWTSDEEEFCWDQYIKTFNSTIAPHSLFNTHTSAEEMGFKCGMKLEAVNPDNQQQICVASIVKSVAHLLWIYLECNDIFHPNHIRSFDSLDIFPSGWCESNSYPLKLPKVIPRKKDYSQLDSERSSSRASSLCSSQEEPSLWCSRIYFNNRCFSGPFLNKTKLAKLPKVVGPGPVTLVLKEVLTMIISVAYKATRVLQELKSDGKPEPGYEYEVLQAKYQTKLCRANVAIVTSADRVADYCKDVCKKLRACPHLFGPVLNVEHTCPHKCHKVSKNNWARLLPPKKKILVREVGDVSNSLVNKQESTEPKLDTVVNSLESKLKYLEDNNDRNIDVSRLKVSPRTNIYNTNIASKQKLAAKELPKSQIKTRGLKLPNFALQMRENYMVQRYYEKTFFTTAKRRAEKAKRLSASTQVQHANAVKEKYRVLREKKEWRTLYKIKQKKKKADYEELESNPLLWSPDDVYKFVMDNGCNAIIAEKFRSESVDGYAFMLLNINSLKDYIDSEPEVIDQLSKLICRVRYAHYFQFGPATTKSYP